jgi:hypothetical protein
MQKASKRDRLYALKKGLAFVSVNECKIVGMTFDASRVIHVGIVKPSVGMFVCMPCMSGGSNKRQSLHRQGQIPREEADHAAGLVSKPD